MLPVSGRNGKTDMPGSLTFLSGSSTILRCTCIHRPSAVIGIAGTIRQSCKPLPAITQFIQGRSTILPLDDIRDRALLGLVHRTGYGEPFVCREPIGLRSLRDFI